MQPFVQMDAAAFKPLVDSMPNPLQEMQKQQAFRVGLEAQQADTAHKRAAVTQNARKIGREQEFQGALQQVMADPDATKISALMMQFPEFSEELKRGWDTRDKAARQSDFTQLSEMWSALEGGDVNLAATVARRRYEADKSAGQADETDLAIVEALESGEPEQVARAKGMIGTLAAGAGGPEHFASVTNSMRRRLKEIDGIVYDEDSGEAVFQSPIPRVIPGTNGSFYVQDRPEGIPTIGGANQPQGQAGPQEGAAPVSGAEGEVASVLSSAGVSPVALAGFLGNFNVEGGYYGAKGDGGTASGIAQWRGDRQTNFKRIIGKPVEQASPAEQARFVVWEMQNPQAAGMTVAQRDAILAAKTPAQAAFLIDKHYERSAGKHTQQRIEAANRYASNGTGPRKVRSIQEAKALPAGTRFIDPNGVERVR